MRPLVTGLARILVAHAVVGAAITTEGRDLDMPVRRESITISQHQVDIRTGGVAILRTIVPGRVIHRETKTIDKATASTEVTANVLHLGAVMRVGISTVFG